MTRLSLYAIAALLWLVGFWLMPSSILAALALSGGAGWLVRAAWGRK
jgi:hypothetical protein